MRAVGKSLYPDLLKKSLTNLISAEVHTSTGVVPK